VGWGWGSTGAADPQVSRMWTIIQHSSLKSVIGICTSWLLASLVRAWCTLYTHATIYHRNMVACHIRYSRKSVKSSTVVPGPRMAWGQGSHERI
jgi:hypothetical protein